VSSPGIDTKAHKTVSSAPARHEDQNLADFGGAPSIEADYTRRFAPRPLAIGLTLLVLAAVLIPFDGAINGWAASIGDRLGGDLKRELETYQQFGGLGSIILVAVLIVLLDSKRKGRLVDLGLVVAATFAVVQPAKMLIGRPRPRFDDPGVFLGPFGRYEVSESIGPRHAWEIGSGIQSDLWSMPSSHTAFAVALGAFLVALYPRILPLVIFLVALVGAARVLLNAHYPSDVVAGGAVGYALSAWILSRRATAA